LVLDFGQFARNPARGPWKEVSANIFHIGFQRSGRTADLVDRSDDFLLIGRRQQCIEIGGQRFGLLQDRGAAVLDVVENAGPDFDARRALFATRQQRRFAAVVVQLDIGDAGHALVAERAEGRMRDRSARVDADAHQDFAGFLRIEADAVDLADFQPAIPYRGLRIEARYR
jgi:hypothetical protein